MKNQRKDTNSEEVLDEFLERFADLLWQSLEEQSKNKSNQDNGRTNNTKP